MKTHLLEMSQGAGEKMYTLWRVPNYENKEVSPYATSHFITNLSIDHDKAFIKATEYATRVGLDLIDTSVDELVKIIRESDLQNGMIGFGKHRGEFIKDLEDGYLTWLAEGGQVTVTTDGDSYVKKLAPEITEKLAMQEALKRNLFIEYEGKILSQRFINYLEKQKVGFGHHFADKSKVKLIVKLIKETWFDSVYGRTYILTFEDKNGLKFQYKGSTPPQAEKDMFVELTATVKLDSYNNRDTTYLQRVKILTPTYYQWVTIQDKNDEKFRGVSCQEAKEIYRQTYTQMYA